MLYIKTANTGVKFPQPLASAFDTDWLHRIANLSNTISNELRQRPCQRLAVERRPRKPARMAGSKSIVTVMAKSGVPDNDYLKNSFLENADTRRVYRFDDQSEICWSLCRFILVRPSGETQIFDLSEIDYNQPIDPKRVAARLAGRCELGAIEPPQELPDNEKYASMTAEQAARAFFEACSREDWNEAAKFMSPINDQLKAISRRSWKSSASASPLLPRCTADDLCLTKSNFDPRRPRNGTWP